MHRVCRLRVKGILTVLQSVVIAASLFPGLVLGNVPDAAFRDSATGNIKLAVFGSTVVTNAFGVFAGTPSSAQDELVKTYVSALDASGGAWMNSFNQSTQTWNGWQYGSGPFAGTPAISVANDGTVWACYRDKIYHNYWLVSYTAASGFGAFQNLGGNFASDPVMAVAPDNSRYVAGLDTPGSAWAGHLITGVQFTGFTLLGGTLTQSPALAVGSDNAAYLIANDAQSVAWMGRLLGTVWSGWSSTGAVTGSSPTIGAAASSLYAAVRNPAGALYTCSWVIGMNTCNVWTSRGGVVQSISASVQGGDLYIAARDSAGNGWWYRLSTNQWTADGSGVTAGSTLAAASITPWAGISGQSIPSMGTLIPAGSTSIAETLMFVTNTNSDSPTNYVSMIIENSGAYASNSNNVNRANACYIQYLASALPPVLLLAKDNPDLGWVNPSGTIPGTPGQPSNAQCTLDTGRSWVQVVVGNKQLTIQLAITFQSTWNGPKEMYFDVGAQNSSEMYWSNRGSWTVPNVSQSQVPVTTDHYDVFRTGANVHETALMPSTVGTLTVKKAISLDSCAYAQPLYIPRVSIAGVLHNVVYVATANATIYAFDADNTSPAPLWTPRSLGTAAGPSDGDIYDCTLQISSGPSGVIGTPVIDLASNIMYVVGNLLVSGVTRHKIFGIDITTGQDRITPILIADPNSQFNSAHQLERGGLLLADYNVIVPYASYADTTPYQGWLFSFDRGLTMQDFFKYSNQTFDFGSNHGGIQPVSGAGIWMSGGGAAFDGTRAYASTGNNVDCPQQPPCPSFPPLALSNSLLQVNPYGAQNLGLGQISQFQPPQASSWVNGDADLGSSRVIVVPGTNYVLVGGKAGNIYILDRTSLTGGSLMATFHVGAGNTSSIGPIISGGLAYWNRTIYTWSGYDTLRSFSLDSALLNSLPSQNPPSNPPNNEQGSALSVSSNFDTNGLLWTVVPSGEHNDAAGGHIQAYDLSNFNQALWSHDLNGEEIMKFIAPVVANGKVYVTTNGSKATMPLTPPHLLVYGLP